MNSEKTAVIDLLNQLAKELNLTTDNLLRLYDICGTYLGIQEARVFYGLIKACTFQSYRNQIDLFLSNPVGLPISNDDILVLTCYGEGYKYFYLYDLITVAYYGGGLFKNQHLLSYAWESKITAKKEVIKPAVIADPVIVVANKKEVEDFGNSKEVTPIVSTTPVVWGVQQAEALGLIYKWLKTKNRNQIFRLFGPGGVGKTACAKAIAEFVQNEQGKNNVPKGEVLYAAYTGKAVSVLKRSGCLNAATLHSLIYRPVIDKDTGKCTSFTLNPESPIATASLLVVDEASMVNPEMAADILSFGVSILVLGDPFQLPPIHGTGFFTECKPDYLLTEIHRQAKGSPIIYLATRVREGKSLKPGKYGESRIYEYGNHVSDELILDSSQIIVGLNATRKTMNTRVRKLNGNFEKNPIYPVKGERLIALKNNAEKTIFNGSMWKCSQPTLGPIMQPKFKNSKYMVQGSLDVLKFKIQSEDERDAAGKLLVFNTQCGLHHFNSSMQEPNWRDLAGADSFEFAAAITTHKCVHPETMVETLEGYLPIKLITNTGSIATDTGSQLYLNKVVNGDNSAIRTICENNYSITTTIDHKMEVWRSGISSMVESKDVVLGDWMRLKLGATIDVKNLFKLPDLKNLEFDSRINTYNLPTHCNEQVAEFLGYMVATGFLIKNKQGFRFITKQKKVFNLYKKLVFNLFNINIVSTNIRNSYSYILKSNYLGAWLNLILDSTFNECKTIPECIYRSPLLVQAAFIKSLFSSSTLKIKNTKVDYLELNSNSAAFIQKIQQMLLRLNIISSTKLTTTCPKLYIYGKQVKKFVDNVGFVNLPVTIKNKDFIKTELRFKIPISLEDFNKLENYACLDSNSKSNFLRTNFLSRDMCRRFIARSENAKNLLEWRLDWHWVRVTEKTLGISSSMCVEVPKGNKFLQNGFPHSNSQGSQFDSVLLFDESQSFGDSALKWLYTAISRSVEKVTIQM